MRRPHELGSESYADSTPCSSFHRAAASARPSRVRLGWRRQYDGVPRAATRLDAPTTRLGRCPVWAGAPHWSLSWRSFFLSDLGCKCLDLRNHVINFKLSRVQIQSRYDPANAVFPAVFSHK